MNYNSLCFLYTYGTAWGIFLPFYYVLQYFDETFPLDIKSLKGLSPNFASNIKKVKDN